MKLKEEIKEKLEALRNNTLICGASELRVGAIKALEWVLKDSENKMDGLKLEEK